MTCCCHCQATEKQFDEQQADIERLLDAAGLECCYRKSTFIWEVVGYRPGAAAGWAGIPCSPPAL